MVTNRDSQVFIEVENPCKAETLPYVKTVEPIQHILSLRQKNTISHSPHLTVGIPAGVGVDDPDHVGLQFSRYDGHLLHG